MTAPGAASTFDEALRFNALGRLTEAERACRQTLQRDACHEDARRLRADILRRTARIGEAVEFLERSAEMLPESLAILHDLGLLQLSCRHPAAAVAAFKRALALDPALAALHNNLGVALKDLGSLKEAEAAYAQALRLDPGYAAAHHNRGELLMLRGELPEARLSLEHALRLNPEQTETSLLLGNVLLDLDRPREAAARFSDAVARNPSAATNLGIALERAGDTEGAINSFRAAVVACPESAEVHINLANGLLVAGKPREALASAQAALRLQSNLRAARALYATALAALGEIEAGAAQICLAGDPLQHAFGALGAKLTSLRQFDRARECFQRALQFDPEDAMARHLLAALDGENPEHPPQAYVCRLFDAYAATFDQHLLSGLSYTIPAEMVEALASVQRGAAEPWDVLDLGCGTGLVGAAIASRSRRLVGIDLAEKMLEQARARQLYTELRCTDLLAALGDSEAGTFDVVTAADVFIYVGKLDDLARAVRRVLRAGGLFAFSVETPEADGSHSGALPERGYRLRPTGRYGHRVEYLEQLAQQCDFEVRLAHRTRIRLETRRPVAGYLYVWQSRGVRGDRI